MKKVWFRVGMEAEISDSDWQALKKLENNPVYKNRNGKYATANTPISQKDIDRAVEIMHNMIVSGSLSGETYIPESWDDNQYANDKEINFEF